MRRKPTDAERRMWALLRDRRLTNYKFRRQVPIGPYIVDFFCADAKLIVELDGTQHADSPHDAKRDVYLAAQGFQTLRIWNNDILARPQQVLEAVWVRVEGK
jgi:very-short-patch-repair endonuclease